MQRPFPQEAFRQFVLSDELREHAPALRRTTRESEGEPLAAWSPALLKAVRSPVLADAPDP